MFILISVEHPGVQAGRRRIVMIEDLLNFAQGHTQSVESMGGSVPGHMRFARCLAQICSTAWIES